MFDRLIKREFIIVFKNGWNDGTSQPDLMTTGCHSVDLESNESINQQNFQIVNPTAEKIKSNKSRKERKFWL